MNDNFSDIDIPEQEDYRAVIEPSLRQTRRAIREALGYIQRQEDGPFTMTVAIRKIERLLSAIEVESWYLTGRLDRLHMLINTVLEQRNEAIHQRDLLRLLSEWSDPPDAPDDNNDKDGKPD